MQMSSSRPVRWSSADSSSSRWRLTTRPVSHVSDSVRQCTCGVMHLGEGGCCSIPYVVGRPEAALEWLTYFPLLPLHTTPLCRSPNRPDMGRQGGGLGGPDCREGRAGGQRPVAGRAGAHCDGLHQGREEAAVQLSNTAPCEKAVSDSPRPLLVRLGLNCMDVRPAQTQLNPT